MSSTSETHGETAGTGPSQRSAEIGVAIALAVLAAIGIYGSLQVGIGWAAEGPQAGFFPFYVSLIVLLSCAINLINTLREPRTDALFAQWSQLRQVFAVVIPTTFYVFLVPVLGIYVSSGLLIGVFMKWLGNYGWPLVISISLAIPVLTFLMFEQWFLVPLPKGPLENWLGY